MNPLNKVWFIYLFICVYNLCFVSTDNVRLLRFLAPYYGHPPLALLCFHGRLDYLFSGAQFLVLSEQAGVPHGTPIFRLMQRLKLFEDFTKQRIGMYTDDFKQIFEDMHSKYLTWP